MNYQFFGTAGICSGVLWLAAVVLFILIISDLFTWDTEYKLGIATWVCFLLPVAFWIIIGILCGLNALWGWGLVR